jgi:hypothetical protein
MLVLVDPDHQGPAFGILRSINDLLCHVAQYTAIRSTSPSAALGTAVYKPQLHEAASPSPSRFNRNPSRSWAALSPHAWAAPIMRPPLPPTGRLDPTPDAAAAGAWMEACVGRSRSRRCSRECRPSRPACRAHAVALPGRCLGRHALPRSARAPSRCVRAPDENAERGCRKATPGPRGPEDASPRGGPQGSPRAGDSPAVADGTRVPLFELTFAASGRQEETACARGGGGDTGRAGSTPPA